MTPDSAAPGADFERIRPQPRASDAPRAVTSAGDGAARVSGLRFAIALALVLVVGGFALMFLPRVFAPMPGAPPQPQAAAPAAAQPAPQAPAPALTDDAALEARSAAQDARTQFTEQLAQLEARGAAQWAAQALAEVQRDAQSGATAFAAKGFASARDHYQRAAGGTASLLAGIPQRLAAALAEGAQALESGDKVSAQRAYTLALQLEPGNAAAQRGLERVQSFDAVRAATLDAQRLEQAGDAGARSAWAQVLKLDADSRSAREAIARLDAQARDREFAAALGQSLAALDRGALDAAQTALTRANSLRAQDAGLKQAQGRLAEARRVQKLANLQAQAASQATAEDWSGALDSYRAALALDPTLAFALEGAQRAEPRAALAQGMAALIARPDRLSSAAVTREAQALLAQARAVSEPAPRLQAQIAQLDAALASSAVPVAVQLRSDGQTEVSVLRVGSFGRVTAQTLSLKPGSYVALGSRNGYRDVRQEFQVAPGAANLTLDVRCTEPL